MALSEQERERIMEEERARLDARRALLQESWAQRDYAFGHGCGHGVYRRRGWRLLFWLPLLGLLAWSLSHAFCHL
jgi:hypothetical protein